MAQELTAAMKNVKVIERELTVAENRLAYVNEEVKRASQARDAIQAEIDKKSSDYQIFIAQRDADSKKMRQDVLDERDQMAKDRADFQEILKQFKAEQAAFASHKEEMQTMNKRHEAQTNNVREFIIAVQRASSLLNL